MAPEPSWRSRATNFEFARKYELEVIEVVQPPEGSPGLSQGACFTGAGTSVNSGPIDGLPTAEAFARTIELLEERSAGRAKTSYRLRDWLFSRQRYWGEPFPLLHLQDGSVKRVPDEQLPVLLPEMTDFTPSADGSPPLARATDWVQSVDSESGEPAMRATDTMPGWAGSCWYYLRFIDPRREDAPFSAEAERYWNPVDLYVGGASHAVMHLLYARFWHKVFYDLGIVSRPEPFQKLFNQGILTATAFQDASSRSIPADEVERSGEGWIHKDSGEEARPFVAAMSKTLRNVINPDDVIEEQGADTFRLYEMFMAPLGDTRSWDPRGISGCRRFLDRLWKLYVDPESDKPVRAELLNEQPRASEELERVLNLTLKRVDDSFEHFNFNTAIAAMMTFINEAVKRPGELTRSQASRLLLALAPFAPHIAEELWERLDHGRSIARAGWPEVDEAYLAEEQFELVVQVMGKIRGRVPAARSASKGDLEKMARNAVAQQLAGKEIVKTIVVPGRLVNFVVR